MGRSSGMPLWQRQSAGESRSAWTEPTSAGRATAGEALQPLRRKHVPIIHATSLSPLVSTLEKVLSEHLSMVSFVVEYMC